MGALPAAPVNLLAWLAARCAVTTFQAFGRPWSSLAERVPRLTVLSMAFGGAYTAFGLAPDVPSEKSSGWRLAPGAAPSSPERTASPAHNPRPTMRRLRFYQHGAKAN